MTTPKYFNSKVKELNKFATNMPDSSIKSEPMFFNCDLEYAFEKGGYITQSFIENLPPEWKHSRCVFDSRVHMLMPGWYPAIPGFHHDDVPRPDIPVGQHFITAGQPDYETPRYKSEHIMGLVNADICPTVFAIGECDMPAIDEQTIMTYDELAEKIQSMTAKEIIMAMVEGLQNPVTKIDMTTFGEKMNGICYGCAATNAICRIGGLDPNYEICVFGPMYSISNNILATFESAIDSLRKGQISEYNDKASMVNVAQIKANGEFQVYITTQNYHDPLILKKFIDLANDQ